jgi:hypothetical protein
MKDIYIPEFSVYPNPATDQVMINVFYKFSNRAVLNIYNPAGELLLVQSILNSGDGPVSYNIDVSNLTPGIYFIRMKDGENEVPGSKKLVVQ